MLGMPWMRAATGSSLGMASNDTPPPPQALPPPAPIASTSDASLVLALHRDRSSLFHVMPLDVCQMLSDLMLSAAVRSVHLFGSRLEYDHTEYDQLSTGHMLLVLEGAEQGWFHVKPGPPQHVYGCAATQLGARAGSLFSFYRASASHRTHLRCLHRTVQDRICSSLVALLLIRRTNISRLAARRSIRRAPAGDRSHPSTRRESTDAQQPSEILRSTTGVTTDRYILPNSRVFPWLRWSRVWRRLIPLQCSSKSGALSTASRRLRVLVRVW